MKKIIAVLLVTIMTLSLFACAKSDSIIGKWKYEADITDAAMESAGDSFDTSAMQSRLICPVYFEFKDNGEYEIAFDAQALTESMQTFMAEFANVMSDYYYTYFEEELGYDHEQADELFVEQYGSNLKEYLSTTLSEMDYEDILEGSDEPITGTYELKDGKIIMNGDETDYIAYTIANGTLTMTAASEAAEEALNATGFVFPATLSRSK